MRFSSICITLLLLISFSCSNRRIKENNDKGLLKLDLVKAHQNNRELKLSEIGSDIEYVFLETNPKSLIGGFIRQIIPYQDFIIVLTNKNISVFDRNSGKFIREIGIKGDKGPEGYYFPIYNFPFNSKRESIYTHQMDIRKIREFSITGEVIKDFSLPTGEYNFTTISDDTFVSSHANASGQDSILLHVFNQNGETLFNVSNDQFYLTEPGVGIAYGPPVYFKKDKQLFYIEQFHDTIYQLSKEGIRPTGLIERGKFLPPYERKGESKFSKEFNSDYLSIWSIFEIPGSIICNFKINKKLYFALFDLKKQEVASAEKLPLQGFTNDIDGFVPFIPSFQSEEGFLIGYIEGIYLDEWSQAHSKELEGMENLPAINENMNPLVMIVTPKTLN